MSPRLIIVFLGLGLTPDGSMPPMLLERCQVAAKLNKTRHLPIINTGGDPRHTDVTEAKMMTDYMVTKLGVKQDEIIMEDTAVSTCTNAINTFQIMEMIPNWIGILHYHFQNIILQFYKVNTICPEQAICLDHLPKQED